MSNEVEQVLVFSAEVLNKVGEFSGFKVTAQEYLDAIMVDDSLQFMDRSKAETNRDFKQLIPYQIIKCGDKVFTYIRTKSSGEERLRSKRSFGIGGHINDTDGKPCEAYANGRLRELTEEVVVDEVNLEYLLGVIYDPSNDVGQVHFGVVHVLEVDSKDIEVIDLAIADGKFVSFDELKNTRNEYEGWSQIIIDNVVF